MTDDSSAAVGIVVVSHSGELADATVRLVARLANLPSDGPLLVAAGGLEDGSIGTDATRIADALVAADAGAGVVVLADLGSAVLATATAIDELIDPDLAARVRISRGPLVEGTFVAAVQASARDALDGVLAAADDAASMNKLEGR
ncbi:MAG: dihydroxyacetone kinase phosphoryl donor subunit DhaM [Chloroflexota bacterium]|jgi:dihydroxyacetone kinase phosphotransfer subunit|nr:dihydroxyacetone kinase phosphoryl donor subunit DhaM [Chloroflexota bacterium]